MQMDWPLAIFHPLSTVLQLYWNDVRAIMESCMQRNPVDCWKLSASSRTQSQDSLIGRPALYSLSYCGYCWEKTQISLLTSVIYKHFVCHLNFLPCIANNQNPMDITLKALIMTAADDIHKYFFIVFLEKIRCDVSNESSARQRIHMKNQA